MSINSKNKGKQGELEVVHKLKDYGFLDVRRSQQFAGVNGDSDVVGLDGIHIEVKRVEKLNIEKAMQQAKEDSKHTTNTPTVFHRRNREDWKVTMYLDDWIELYKKALYNR